MLDKLVVTNLGALASKYGARVHEVNAALERLVAADAARGLRTRVVGLDDQEAMAALGVSAARHPVDPQQAKTALDALFAAVVPDYVLLLGATDVIPHQPLANPVFAPDGDGDEFAYGDLPYACEAPFSTDPAEFIAPTRVVGRLPDLTGATDPGYLVALLEATAGWQPGTPDDYLACLGVSAAVWQGSTRLSLRRLFGPGAQVELSPDRGPQWAEELLARRVHFINCHGAEADPRFYGQDGDSFPVAHDGTLIDGRLARGTIAAVECCYGAELYDPAVAGGQPGMANVYLGNGAYGFFGSSTIAYGPAEGNGAADLICQFFLSRVLAGASLGRAALEARQDYVREVTVVDPVDLKTLAQFSLLGDPSIHPVRVPSEQRRSPKTGPGTARPSPTEPDATGEEAALTPGRDLRRRNLEHNGLVLSRSTSVARTLPEAQQPAALREQLRALTGEPAEPAVVRSYLIQVPPGQQVRHALAAGIERLHVAMARGTMTRGGDGPVPLVTVVVARERDGDLVSYRTLYSR
jgi:hypothetical protein